MDIIPSFSRGGGIRCCRVEKPLFFTDATGFGLTFSFGLSISAIIVGFLGSEVISRSTVITVSRISGECHRGKIGILLDRLDSSYCRLLSNTGRFVRISVLRGPCCEVPSGRLSWGVIVIFFGLWDS